MSTAVEERQGTQASPAPAPKPKAEVATRDYVILRLVEETEAGVEPSFDRLPGFVNSRSDREAVKTTMSKLGVQEGTFVAIAKASWHEHTRTIEKVEKATWS